MADAEHAQSLIRMARKDFNALVGMRDNPLFADEIFGFHAQQAIEKALKAWLSSRDTTYPLTHELARLLTLLENRGEQVEPFWPLVEYTVFAVQARYEEGIADLDEPLNRDGTIEFVGTLLEHVERRLSRP